MTEEPMSDRDQCAHCGKDLPPNWGTAFCPGECAKKYTEARRALTDADVAALVRPRRRRTPPRRY
jgi:hypothetical protein